MGLTVRQSRFVAAYLKHPVAKDAAIEAGYRSSNAETQGSDLLKNPEVSQAISDAQKRRAERVEVKADDVLRSVLRSLKADPRLLVDDEGKPIPLHELDEEVALAIDAVRAHKDGSVEYRFSSRSKAQELAMRHLGLLLDRVDHTSNGKSFAELVAATLKKPGAKS